MRQQRTAKQFDLSLRSEYVPALDPFAAQQQQQTQSPYIVDIRAADILTASPNAGGGARRAASAQPRPRALDMGGINMAMSGSSSVHSSGGGSGHARPATAVAPPPRLYAFTRKTVLDSGSPYDAVTTAAPPVTLSEQFAALAEREFESRSPSPQQPQRPRVLAGALPPRHLPPHPLTVPHPVPRPSRVPHTLCAARARVLDGQRWSAASAGSCSVSPPQQHRSPVPALDSLAARGWRTGHEGSVSDVDPHGRSTTTV